MATAQRHTLVHRDAPLVDVRLRKGGYIIDGRPYPRVSALLEALPRPWLSRWEVNRIVDYAVSDESWRELSKKDARRALKSVPDQIRDAAAERGLRIHAAVQARLKGGSFMDLEADDEYQSVDRALKFLWQWGFKVRGVEVTVWSDHQRYAGTLDIWGEKDGELWILDWKTGSGAYVEHALQVASYKRAEYAQIDGRRRPWGESVVKHAGVVHVTPNEVTLHRVVGVEALVPILEAARTIYDWQQPTAPAGLGEPETFHFDGLEPMKEKDMPIIVSDTSNGEDFPPHPEGQFAARCIDIIDLGDVETTFQGRTKKRHRGIIRFYAGESSETGEPLWADKFVTLSLHKKASLRTFLEAWRGKKFTDEELQGFDLEVLLGVDAYIQVSHNVTPNRVYANIDSIMQRPKGVKRAPELEGYVRVCDREEHEEESHEEEAVGVGAEEDDDELPF